MLSRPSTLYNSTLKHLVYDGVYADSEERLMGGGSLELKKNVTKELNLNKNSITGNWDYSHNLQLVWADVLKKKPFCLEKLKYTSQLWKLCIVVKLRHISLRRLKSLNEIFWKSIQSDNDFAKIRFLFWIPNIPQNELLGIW